MTVAIFGLIGVIVGGVLNGVVATLLDSHRNRKALQTAARLVLWDVATAQTVYKQCLDANAWEVLPIRPFSLEQWDEWKVTLTSGLKDSTDWRKVISVFLDTQHYNDLASRHQVHDTLSAPSREGMEQALARADEALPVLAPLVRGEHFLPHRAARRIGLRRKAPAALENKTGD